MPEGCGMFQYCLNYRFKCCLAFKKIHCVLQKKQTTKIFLIFTFRSCYCWLVLCLFLFLCCWVYWPDCDVEYVAADRRRNGHVAESLPRHNDGSDQVGNGGPRRQEGQPHHLGGYGRRFAHHRRPPYHQIGERRYPQNAAEEGHRKKLLTLKKNQEKNTKTLWKRKQKKKSKT